MAKIKILHAHNYYLQAGGEDTAFKAEVNLLRNHEHEVIKYVEDNQRIAAENQVSIAAQTIWSWDTYRELKEVLRRERPQIAHFHNTFPLISPAAYYACYDEKVPVIQSLDNPRLLCPSANFYRDGQLCQDCIGRTPPWPGIVHRCYHNSAFHTSVVALMLGIHRWISTWNTKVDFYLVATDFYKRKFVEGNLPADKFVVKPHFIDPDPQFESDGPEGSYALYIGRLDPEKGIRTLLSAWKQLPELPLKIRGDGQLEKEVQAFIQNNRRQNVELVDRLDKSALVELIRGAKYLVWPSEGFYETFGFVAVESFALGVPVIGSRIGVNAEIVKDGVTGLHFAAGDSNDLASKAKWAWEHPSEMMEMGKTARREYEEKYTAERNYEMLMDIYQRAIELKKNKEH